MRFFVHDTAAKSTAAAAAAAAFTAMAATISATAAAAVSCTTYVVSVDAVELDDLKKTIICAMIFFRHRIIAISRAYR